MSKAGSCGPERGLSHRVFTGSPLLAERAFLPHPSPPPNPGPAGRWLRRPGAPPVDPGRRGTMGLSKQSRAGQDGVRAAEVQRERSQPADCTAPQGRVSCQTPLPQIYVSLHPPAPATRTDCLLSPGGAPPVARSRDSPRPLRRTPPRSLPSQPPQRPVTTPHPTSSRSAAPTLLRPGMLPRHPSQTTGRTSPLRTPTSSPRRSDRLRALSHN